VRNLIQWLVGHVINLDISASYFLLIDMEFQSRVCPSLTVSFSISRIGRLVIGVSLHYFLTDGLIIKSFLMRPQYPHLSSEQYQASASYNSHLAKKDFLVVQNLPLPGIT
jgi:hypothetical protein